MLLIFCRLLISTKCINERKKKIKKIMYTIFLLSTTYNAIVYNACCFAFDLCLVIFLYNSFCFHAFLRY